MTHCMWKRVRRVSCSRRTPPPRSMVPTPCAPLRKRAKSARKLQGTCCCLWQQRRRTVARPRTGRQPAARAKVRRLDEDAVVTRRRRPSRTSGVINRRSGATRGSLTRACNPLWPRGESQIQRPRRVVRGTRNTSRPARTGGIWGGQGSLRDQGSLRGRVLHECLGVRAEHRRLDARSCPVSPAECG